MTSHRPPGWQLRSSRQLMETSIGDIGSRNIYQMINGRFFLRRRRSASADFCMSFLLRAQTVGFLHAV
jgi:hypothetical protein